MIFPAKYLHEYRDFHGFSIGTVRPMENPMEHVIELPTLPVLRVKNSEFETGKVGKTMAENDLDWVWKIGHGNLLEFSRFYPCLV